MVYLLRQRRDHGWTPTPPAPRADAPKILGAYFAQRAADQEAEHPTNAFPLAAPPVPPPEAAQPPSLTELWQDTLAGLRLRLPRNVYQICVRQATLISYADDVATISVCDMRTREQLERGYSGALRFALGDALGRDVTVRMVIRASNAWGTAEPIDSQGPSDRGIS